MDTGTLPDLANRYPLLVTKLYIPVQDTGLLERPPLAERLNQAMHRPLVTIIAPAGWGKTTLVASWARQTRRPVGWLSLDEGDNDLSRFWLHFISALQQVRPGVGEAALMWFYTQGAPPVEQRLTLLINELALADETFILVLDDVHCLRSPTVHESLTWFVEHQPPNVHLILISRSELPLPLARWRTRGLAEFNSQDLRFSNAESDAFLRQVMGLDLTPDQVAALADRTEGWIAGLQLASLAMQAPSAQQAVPPQQAEANCDQFIQDLCGTSRYILDYLSEEVLTRQSSEVQEFLLKTSVLERMSGDLGAAVTGIRESPHILEWLEQNKLFIVALDPERRWYRYHHLFRDFLSNQLTRVWPDQIPDLDRRAAQWFADHGMPREAVAHALTAQDYALAGRIIMQYGNELWWREEMETLGNWLTALPQELRDRHPDLCLFHAWSLFFTLKLDEMGALVARAERLLDEGAAPLGNFSIAELRAILAVIQASMSALKKDYPATFAFSQFALAQLPPEEKDWRYAALVPAAVAHLYRGETQAAVQAFEEAVALKRDTGNRFGGAFALSSLARVYALQGRLHRAKEVYEESIALATGQTGKPLPIAAWALTGLGELCYEWNDLERAEKYFEDSLALSTQVTPATAPPYIPLARLAHAHGDTRSAETYFTQAQRLAETAHQPFYAEQVNVCAAWLALWRGERAALERWVQELGLEQIEPGPLRDAEYTMAARILIALHSHPQALELIERLLAPAETAGRGAVVVELLILQALALHAQGKSDAALDVLQGAVERASPEGYVRLFVDEGEPMLQLLRRLVARARTTDYTARLLSAFAKRSENPDLLNERETEIVRLLATGMSNAEIAQALSITVGTVKWHTNHIYSKLGVKNRGQAVAKARELHLLETATHTPR